MKDGEGEREGEEVKDGEGGNAGEEVKDGEEGMDGEREGTTEREGGTEKKGRTRREGRTGRFRCVRKKRIKELTKYKFINKRCGCIYIHNILAYTEGGKRIFLHF